MSNIFDNLIGPVLPDFFKGFRKHVPRLVDSVIDISDSFGIAVKALNEMASKMPSPETKENTSSQVKKALHGMIGSIIKDKQDAQEEDTKHQPINFTVKTTCSIVDWKLFQEPFTESSLLEFLTLVSCKGKLEIIPPKEVFIEYRFCMSDGYKKWSSLATEGAWTILFHSDKEND